jgi:hypothetical protein
MINMIFDLCVQFLIWLANGIGMTYQAVNVWIFVVIWPVFTLALIATVIAQARALHKLKSEHRAG